MSGSVSLINGHIDPDKKPMTFEDVKRTRENPTAEDVDNRELHRLIDEAIEKQIPKKPNEYKDFEDGAFYNIDFLCPACNTAVIGQPYKPKHCKHCGQALDWSDTE